MSVPAAASAWPWWLAGCAIGLYVVLLAWVSGKALGISSGYGTVCSIATGLPCFKQQPYTERWRLWFLLGLPLGAWLAALARGGWGVTWELGVFEQMVTGRAAVKAAALFGGGVLIGAGSRWAGGCTSGHSIVGIALGAVSSLLATAGFMLGGLVTTHLLYGLGAR